MKGIYLVQYYPPENASGLSLVKDLLEGFTTRAGWRIDLFCPTPTRGVDDDTRKVYCGEKKIEIKCNGKLHINRMALLREKKGFIPRTIRYIIFSFECLMKSMTVPADFIFTGSGPPTQGLVAGFAGKMTNKKVIYNLQDIFPDSLITSGICSEHSILYKIGKKIEINTYKNADLIITISDDMKKNLLGKGVSPSKIVMIPNWIDVHSIEHVSDEKNTLFHELHLDPNKFYITYAGNIGYVQAIDEIIDATELLGEHSEIQFVIFGEGSEKEKIEEKIKHKKIDNVSLFPLQPLDRISEVYSLGQASIVSCKKGTSGSGLPSKTWSIMGASCAVLGYFDIPSEFSNIVTANECGVCVQSGDTKKLAEKIIELSENRELCSFYGTNGRKYVENYASKESAVKKYIDCIQKIVGE